MPSPVLSTFTFSGRDVNCSGSLNYNNFQIPRGANRYLAIASFVNYNGSLDPSRHGVKCRKPEYVSATFTVTREGAFLRAQDASDNEMTRAVLNESFKRPPRCAWQQQKLTERIRPILCNKTRRLQFLKLRGR